jgi:hypothetical protein
MGRLAPLELVSRPMKYDGGQHQEKDSNRADRRAPGSFLHDQEAGDQCEVLG